MIKLAFSSPRRLGAWRVEHINDVFDTQLLRVLLYGHGNAFRSLFDETMDNLIMAQGISSHVFRGDASPVRGIRADRVFFDEVTELDDSAYPFHDVSQ